MKRLLIIRHAKSSWDNPQLSDFDRPLNKRGKNDLPDMARRLKSKNFRIDYFLSSPTKRALITAIGHAQTFGVQERDIAKNQRLYHASSSEIQSLVSQTPKNIQTLALFGHNPGLTDLINNISDFELLNLPTCAVCGIEFNISDWTNILSQKGKMFLYDYPKSTR